MEGVTPRIPQVEDQFNRQEVVIEKLDKLVEVLQTRLASVTRSVPGQVGAAKNEVTALLVPLAQAVCNHTERLDRVVLKLEDLLSTLEL